MNYGIYFDESNKLDQPNGEWSYYAALGSDLSKAEAITQKIEVLNKKIKTYIAILS